MVSAACLDGSPIRSYTASRLTTGSATEAGSMSDSSDDDPTLSPRRPCLRPRSHIARVERYERLRKSSVDHALRADFLEEQLLLHKQGLGFDLEAEVVQQRIALDQRQQEVRQLKLDMVRAAEIIDSLTADRDAAKNENSLLATELEAAKATISNLTTKLCEAEHDRLRAREEVEEALHLNRERADQQTEVERLETERRGLHDQVRYLENRLRASEDAVERGRVTLARERNVHAMLVLIPYSLLYSSHVLSGCCRTRVTSTTTSSRTTSSCMPRCRTGERRPSSRASKTSMQSAKSGNCSRRSTITRAQRLVERSTANVGSLAADRNSSSPCQRMSRH